MHCHYDVYRIILSCSMQSNSHNASYFCTLYFPCFMVLMSHTLFLFLRKTTATLLIMRHLCLILARHPVVSLLNIYSDYYVIYYSVWCINYSLLPRHGNRLNLLNSMKSPYTLSFSPIFVTKSLYIFCRINLSGATYHLSGFI